MKKILGLIGIGLIVGATAYKFLNKKENIEIRESNINIKVKENPNNDVFYNNDSENNINKKIDDYYVDDIKNSAKNSIYARHEKASDVVSKSANVIYNRAKKSENQNSELDKLSDELDKFLSEE